MDAQARSATITITEGPFGDGDPLQVARLVRRALAAGGRKALEVGRLVVVTDADPGRDALDRFTRRALGAHGASVRSAATQVSGAVDHEARIALARAIAVSGASVVVVVVLGPGAVATALCLAA